MKKHREFIERENVSKEIWDPVLGAGRDMAAENAPIGAPRTRAHVESVFGARPINAHDFYANNKAEVITDFEGPS